MTTHTALARDERGSALVGVLLLLMLMTALAGALGVSGQTESLITRNHQSRAQARAAAEAGLNHAIQITVDYLQAIDPVNIPATLDALLNDTTPLAGVEFDTDLEIDGALDADVQYRVFFMDEDDPDRGPDATNLDADANGDNDEDSNELTDNNNTIVLRATGQAQGGSSVTLEALLAPVQLGAIIADGNLDITGSVEVTGADAAHADVHSNGDLTIDGSASVLGDMTASGAYDGPSGGMGGQPEKPLPEINAEDYKHHADFILEDNGSMTCNSAGGCTNVNSGVSWGYGATMCTAGGSGNGCRTDWGWRFAGGGWEMGSAGTPHNGTFYSETDVSIQSGPTLTMTLIAEGSIDLSGSPNLTADTDELLFVTNGDLDISGGIDTSIVAQGQMLVHEQLSISGNATLGGQIIVEDAANNHSLVDRNEISGNVTINYNGALGTNLFFVTGWREVR